MTSATFEDWPGPMSFGNRFRRGVSPGPARAPHGRFGDPSFEVEELSREAEARAQGSRFRIGKILDTTNARTSEKLDKAGSDPGQGPEISVACLRSASSRSVISRND